MSDYFKNTSCYIMAGGKSSRMGGIDKGLMFVDHRRMVELILEKVKPYFADIKIVSNNPDYQTCGLAVLPDLVKDIGPAGGICTALRDCSTKRLFVLSCDMPFVTTEAMAFLLMAAEGYDITLPSHHDKIEPLFSVISKSCEVLWEKSIQQGVYKLQDIMANFNTLRLAVDENKLFAGDFFMNVNTQQSFDEAKQKLRA